MHMVLHGCAGTGKTFLAMYFALSLVLQQRTHTKIIIIRSTVSMRDMGFLPGNKAEKSKEYEGPYRTICSELFGRDDAYEILKRHNIISFEPTSFLRGTTMKDAVILVDEIANMTFQELDGIVTRLGDNARLIMSGDTRQSDFRFNDEKDGLAKFIKIIKNLSLVSFIEMGIEDIVRSAFVKDYLIAKTNQGF
jgi:predicted ribonuclease YlaK